MSCSNESNFNEVLSVQEIINLSNDEIIDSKSFTFSLKHKEGSTELPGGYNISQAKGNIEKPNKILIDADIISNNFLIKVSYLSLNQRYWITNPISFDWMETPSEDNPFLNINPINILSDIYLEIKNTEIIEFKNDEYRLKAQINSNNLTSLVGDIIIINSDVDIELLINSNGFVKKISIFGRVQPNDTKNTIREIKFDNWNEKLKWIEP